jgi:hypothetical protein
MEKNLAFSEEKKSTFMLKAYESFVPVEIVPMLRTSVCSSIFQDQAPFKPRITRSVATTIASPSRQKLPQFFFFLAYLCCLVNISAAWARTPQCTIRYGLPMLNRNFQSFFVVSAARIRRKLMLAP